MGEPSITQDIDGTKGCLVSAKDRPDRLCQQTPYRTCRPCLWIRDARGNQSNPLSRISRRCRRRRQHCSPIVRVSWRPPAGSCGAYPQSVTDRCCSDCHRRRVACQSRIHRHHRCDSDEQLSSPNAPGCVESRQHRCLSICSGVPVQRVGRHRIRTH